MVSRVRVYVREDWILSREWFYQPTDEEFLQELTRYVEDRKEYDEHKDDENFTPENLLAVFKGESDLYDVNEIFDDMTDLSGGDYGMLGDYIESYSDAPEELEIALTPEDTEFWFKRRRQEIIDD